MIIGAESETVEFKLTMGEKKEAVEAIAAILNKHCSGTVYFGVEDSGFVKGQQASDSTKKENRYVWMLCLLFLTSTECLSIKEAYGDLR